MIGQGEGPLEMPGASTEEMLQYKLTAAEEQVAESDATLAYWLAVLKQIRAELIPKDEQLVAMRELLHTSFRIIPNLEDGDIAQYVGSYVLQSDKGYVIPDTGFVQWDDDEIDKALSAAPKRGRVLWEQQAEMRPFGKGWAIIDFEGDLDTMGELIRFLEIDSTQSVTITVREDE